LPLLFRSFRRIDPREIVVTECLAQIRIRSVDCHQGRRVSFLLETAGLNSLPQFAKQFHAAIEYVWNLNLADQARIALEKMLDIWCVGLRLLPLSILLIPF